MRFRDKASPPRPIESLRDDGEEAIRRVRMRAHLGVKRGQLRPCQAFGLEAAICGPQLFQRDFMCFRGASLAFRLDMLGDERINQAADGDRGPLFRLLGGGISPKLYARVSALRFLARLVNGQRSESADLETALGDGLPPPFGRYSRMNVFTPLGMTRTPKP